MATAAFTARDNRSRGSANGDRRVWRPDAWLGWAVALLLLSLPHAADATGPMSFACSRTGANVVVRQAGLPAALRAVLPFRMADPGQQFQVSDIIGPGPRLPSRRMICAYPRDGGFVVEWEVGGIARRRGQSEFRRSGGVYEPR